MPKKYEYEKDYVSPYHYSREGLTGPSPSTETLAKRGAEGWELCAVGAPDSGGTHSVFLQT